MFYRKKEFFKQTLKEEIANCITHGIGVVLSIVALIVMTYVSIKRGNVWYIVCSSCYGASLVLAYMTSTLYHATRNKVKAVMRRLDHISIYLLIAGTYMPISLIALNGKVGNALFGTECVLGLIGIGFKAIFGHKLEMLSGIFYLLMGWLAIFAIGPLAAAFPLQALVWLLAGGVLYTLGFVFFALDQKFHFFHTIWHLFVIGGSVAHFYLIFSYVLI